MVIELEKIIELENSNPEDYSLILSEINDRVRYNMLYMAAY